MFSTRDLPTLEEIRQRAREMGMVGVEPTAVFAALRMLRVADDLAHALELHLQSRYEISTGRFALLMILDRHPDLELTPSDLAERAGVTRATVTGLLDSLEKDGFVARRTHPRDRRRVAAELTEAGRGFIRDTLPDHAKRLGGVTRLLSEAERQQLLGLLEKISAGLDALGTT